MVLIAMSQPVAQAVLGAGAPAAELASGLICLVALGDLIGPAAATAVGILRACYLPRLAMRLALIGNWGISAPLALVLALWLDLGAQGIWIALTAGSGVTAILALRAARNAV